MQQDLTEQRMFPKLSEDLIGQLLAHGREVELNDGDKLFTEGQVGYPFYAVLSGMVRVTRKVGDENQLLAEHGHGSFVGEISMISGSPALATAVAVGPLRVVRLEIEAFRKMIAECSTLAETVLQAMSARSQAIETAQRQQEKLASIGKLAAGLAHELNNPAAAAQRAAASMREHMDRSRDLSLGYDERFAPEQRKALIELKHKLYAQKKPLLTALDQSDREAQVCEWLEAHQFTESWDLSPTLVAAGVTIEHLDRLSEIIPDAKLVGAIGWLESTLRIIDLALEIETSMKRVSELLKSVKVYTRMDEPRSQEVDVHEGIEATLKMFAPRLRGAIALVRAYDASLPLICAYPSQLNQVWTNLIDNALDAMKDVGRLTIRTQREANGGVLVEIGDTGPGIPPALQTRIFEPFFTTKPIGEGTGLGLDICHRIVTRVHGGALGVVSKPGDTRFDVHLPSNPPKEK